MTLPTASLPDSPAALAEAHWADIVPHYEALALAPLDAASVEAWLARWSALDALVYEAAARAMIAYTADTADAARHAAHLRFSTEILPQVEEQEARLARRLVALGWEERPGLETTVRRFRTTVAIFRQANLPRMAELETLAAEYQRVTGGLTAEWEGNALPLPRLLPHLKSPDRAVRQRAFDATSQAYLAVRDQLAGQLDRMLPLRQAMAREAGFSDFQAYCFASKHRYDYTPDDCRRFHDAVAATVVPAATRVFARRRARLGLDGLRPWDTAVDPDGRPPVRAFTDAAEFAARAERVFAAVDPALGAQFGLMREEGLLDLESRPGKAPGGYCETLPVAGRPYVHMNAVGLLEDVMTLLHEAGHCFHSFAAHGHPFIWQRHPGAEAAELASMSMELLALPFLHDPGEFVTAEEAARAEAAHLEDILLTLPHIASVDAFQAWLYTDGERASAAEREAAWVRIRGRFEAGVDWSGLEAAERTRWYRQLHIFIYPFYYIEYGIAQLGALQVWRAARRDHAGAVRRYREALALGATVPLPAMYAAAGVQLSFGSDLLGELVALVEERLEELARG